MRTQGSDSCSPGGSSCSCFLLRPLQKQETSAVCFAGGSELPQPPQVAGMYLFSALAITWK